jgi:hypothetical protein
MTQGPCAFSLVMRGFSLTTLVAKFVCVFLASALAQLEKDRQVGVIVCDFKLMWEELSGIHSVVNKHPLDLAKVLVPSHRSSMATFEFAQPCGTPKPCLHPRLFYDHAFLNHMLEQAELLHCMGLSFALVQSKFLKANNRPVKTDSGHCQEDAWSMLTASEMSHYSRP